MTKNIRRRRFIGTTIKGTMAAGLLTASCTGVKNDNCLDQKFVHHVFFWLKEPVTSDARTRFEKALKDLVTIETITEYHLGVPAPTNREVIYTSYTYSLLTIFNDKAGQDVYQDHPAHLKFIEDCQDLWERVVVYDSVSI